MTDLNKECGSEGEECKRCGLLKSTVDATNAKCVPDKEVIADWWLSHFHSRMQEVEKIDENTSDGYHTFKELYDHRITLYIALTKRIKQTGDDIYVWRSKKHSDGEVCFGTGTQFVLGLHVEKGEQITYHIPIERWNETDFANTLEIAPEYDGHTSQDVLTRLSNLNTPRGEM